MKTNCNFFPKALPLLKIVISRGYTTRQKIKMAGVLFEDIFDVKDIDPEGKKFDRGVKSSNIIHLKFCIVR